MPLICVVRYTILIAILFAPIAQGKSEQPVSCGSRLPAYMVIDNARLEAPIEHMFENFTEFDCTYTCSDDRNRKTDQVVMCSSFNYVHKNSTCFIYMGRASPLGSDHLAKDVKHRYSEKFCLPEGSPLECGESTFLRAEQHVLNGFAVNVTRTKKLDVCIQSCLELNGLCKISKVPLIQLIKEVQKFIIDEINWVYSQYYENKFDTTSSTVLCRLRPSKLAESARCAAW